MPGDEGPRVENDVPGWTKCAEFRAIAGSLYLATSPMGTVNTYLGITEWDLLLECSFFGSRWPHIP